MARGAGAKKTKVTQPEQEGKEKYGQTKHEGKVTAWINFLQVFSGIKAPPHLFCFPSPQLAPSYSRGL